MTGPVLLSPASAFSSLNRAVVGEGHLLLHGCYESVTGKRIQLSHEVRFHIPPLTQRHILISFCCTHLHSVVKPAGVTHTQLFLVLRAVTTIPGFRPTLKRTLNVIINDMSNLSRHIQVISSNLSSSKSDLDRSSLSTPKMTSTIWMV